MNCIYSDVFVHTCTPNCVCSKGITLSITAFSSGDSSRKSFKPEHSPRQFKVKSNAVTSKCDSCPRLQEYDSSAFYIETLQLGQVKNFSLQMEKIFLLKKTFHVVTLNSSYMHHSTLWKSWNMQSGLHKLKKNRIICIGTNTYIYICTK